MNEPKKPAKPRAPRKTKSKPADATDPFVPDEFGVIPPQTGATNLTIKGVPLVFAPGEAETIQGAIDSAFPQAFSQPTSANFLEEQQAGKDGSQDSQTTTATPFPSYFAEPTMNREEVIDRMSRLEVPSTPQPTTAANEKNVGDRFQQDNSTLDAGEHENAGLDAGTTQVDSTDQRKNQGDVAIGPAVADSNSPADSLELPLARVRIGESRRECWERIRKEGRAAGLTRNAAYNRANVETERLFPPPEPVIEPVIVEEIPDEPELEPPISSPIGDIPVDPVAPPAPPPDLGVSGLGELPESWGNLPANAQLQVEIAWVSANRLRVRSGNGVDLSRALSPAPSYSALSWLETSILFPSKFADISVKATADQDDEREHIKREKLAIEEIRSILAEMLEE